MNYLQAQALARKLRKNPTHAELFFWQKVRKRAMLGFRFNRQYVIKIKVILGIEKYFVVDFYCHELRLIVEIDGSVHHFQKDYDESRETLLVNSGYSILRFSNKEVLEDWESVRLRLCQKLK